MVLMHVWYFGSKGQANYTVRLFLCFFCVVETLLFGGEECLSRTCGLVGPDIRAPITASFVVEVFNVGGWLTHGDLVLDASIFWLLWSIG